MTKSRLEAFSDALIAIVMTIMVLKLRAPHGATREDLVPLVPAFFAYVTVRGRTRTLCGGFGDLGGRELQVRPTWLTSISTV